MLIEKLIFSFFVLLGAGFLAFSVVDARQVLKLIEQEKTKLSWRILFVLINIFLAGYLLIIFLVITLDAQIILLIEAVLSLTGFILLFGSLFVFLTIRTSYSTIKDLSQVKQELKSKNSHLSQVNIATDRFVPHEFLALLKKDSVLDIQSGEQIQREMSILFSDIRSFTALSEAMSSKETFDFINAYFQRMVPLVRRNNGFIDKYIGDAIMALFPDKADNAVQAAIDMRRELNLYNNHLQAKGVNPINVGTGIHTGLLTLGTVGESQRLEGTVISDAVNLASRLESLTKTYKVPIIATETILINLDDPNFYNYRFLDRVNIRGKKDSISIFEFFDWETVDNLELKLKTRTEFEQAVLLYHAQKYREACLVFEQILRINHRDSVAQLYLKRCRQAVE